MTQRFNLTPRAKEDLRSIWLYTLDVWGEEQANLYTLLCPFYTTQLYQRFEWLSEQPRIGKHRPDICEGYHCFPQGSHLVFYLVHESVIDLIGIPHKDMYILNYFDTDD